MVTHAKLGLLGIFCNYMNGLPQIIRGSRGLFSFSVFSTSALLKQAKVMKNLEELMEVSPEIPLILDPKRHSCFQCTELCESSFDFLHPKLGSPLGRPSQTQYDLS